MTSNIRLLLALVALPILNSCGSIAKSLIKPQIKKEKNAIPPEYGKNGEVLMLILQKRNSYNKALKKAAEKWYNGPYELVHVNDLGDSKYRDVEKYRYRFYMDAIGKSTQSYNTRTGTMSNGSLTTYQAHMYDNKTGIRYDSPVTSSFYKKILEVYMKKLSESNGSK